MSYITIPATYCNWVIRPIQAITKTPSKIIITLEYDDNESLLEDAILDYKKWENIYEIDDISNLMKKRWVIK